MITKDCVNQYHGRLDCSSVSAWLRSLNRRENETYLLTSGERHYEVQLSNLLNKIKEFGLEGCIGVIAGPLPTSGG